MSLWVSWGVAVRALIILRTHKRHWCWAYLSKLPWIFPGAPLKSMGLPEISRVTWQLCWRVSYGVSMNILEKIDQIINRPYCTRFTISPITNCADADYKSYFQLTKDKKTSLTWSFGELWSVDCEYFGENWVHCNRLYFVTFTVSLPLTMLTNYWCHLVLTYHFDTTKDTSQLSLMGELLSFYFRVLFIFSILKKIYCILAVGLAVSL